MILENHQSFVSPEEALAHYGKKGMRWGVRNKSVPAPPRTKKSTTKKVAIGVGAAGLAAGAGFVAWKLSSGAGKASISAVAKARKAQKSSSPIIDIYKNSGMSAKEIAEAKKLASEWTKFL